MIIWRRSFKEVAITAMTMTSTQAENTNTIVIADAPYDIQLTRVSKIATITSVWANVLVPVIHRHPAILDVQPRSHSTNVFRNDDPTTSESDHEDRNGPDSGDPVNVFHFLKSNKCTKYLSLWKISPWQKRFERHISYHYCRLRFTSHGLSHPQTFRFCKRLQNWELMFKDRKFLGEDTNIISHLMWRPASRTQLRVSEKVCLRTSQASCTQRSQEQSEKMSRGCLVPTSSENKKFRIFQRLNSHTRSHTNPRGPILHIHKMEGERLKSSRQVLVLEDRELSLIGLNVSWTNFSPLETTETTVL